MAAGQYECYEQWVLGTTANRLKRTNKSQFRRPTAGGGGHIRNGHFQCFTSSGLGMPGGSLPFLCSVALHVSDEIRQRRGSRHCLS